MAIPDYHGLMQPTLRALAEAGDDTRFEPLMDMMARRLGLTADTVAERLPSGEDTVFANRLEWALAYLQSTGMVTESKGVYRPTEAGRNRAVDKPPAEANPEPRARPEPCAEVPAPRRANLDDLVAAAVRSLHERLRHVLLARVYQLRPPVFERLIIDLLLAMGYGRRRRDLARRLGRRGDGGIDGAVNQDVLGLDVVYIQAKRYRPGSLVPANAVRDFAGSLDAAKACKGVFATTAGFTESAERFVNEVPSRIVLIDGQRLAELLVQHNIAVRPRETYAIKEIDESYFAASGHLPEGGGSPSYPAANGRRLR